MNSNHHFSYLHLGLPQDVRRLKEFGDFDGALAAIDRHLADKRTSEAMRSALIAQKEIILRLPLDYPLSREKAIALAKKSVPDFSEEEFDALEQAGRIDWIFINGEKRYFDRFFENFIKTDAAIARRAGMLPVGDGQDAKGMLSIELDRLRQKGSTSLRIRCRASVRLKDELFRPGCRVNACLPLPCACDSQRDIQIEAVSPAPVHISPEDAPQRIIFWDKEMEENRAFTVEFSYIRCAEYVDLSKPPKCSAPVDVKPEDLAELPPHILFTPYLNTLAKELTEAVSEPLEKARRIYDYITLNVKYSFMRAYFCLEDIAENCAKSFVGDCGVMTLLFITLCRCAGIPARWESGWKTERDFCGAHDWARFYVEGYGWLYADPSFGCGAARDGNEERRRHYFGNLDPWRMAANTAFQADFDVPKAGWRADPYDNQVGEMELYGEGLRYEHFERSKQVLEIEEIYT